MYSILFLVELIYTSDIKERLTVMDDSQKNMTVHFWSVLTVHFFRPSTPDFIYEKPESERNLNSYQWTPITNSKKIELDLAPPTPPTDPGADKLIQLGFIAQILFYYHRFFLRTLKKSSKVI